MIFSMVMFLACISAGVFLYIKSVSPSIAKNIPDEKIYNRCRIYRQMASIFLNINFLSYIIIKKCVSSPNWDQFHWNYTITLVFALIIAVPGVYFFINGRKDLGYESIAPNADNALVSEGIYQKVRHPQATGEIILWFVWSFILNSPLLVFLSFVWIPVYYLMCLAEERDLLVRFGEAYSEYIKCSGFFLPSICRLTRFGTKALK